MHEYQNVEIRKKNSLMEYTQKHAEATKGNKGNMCKTNSVRKHNRVLLTYERLDTRGVNLTNCGKNNLEVNSVNWLPLDILKGSRILKVDRVSKHSIKLWNTFMKWLRHNKFKTIRYFKAASQWRW